MYIVLILNFSIDTFYRYTSYLFKVNISKNFSKINFQKYFYISRNIAKTKNIKSIMLLIINIYLKLYFLISTYN